MNKNVGNLDRWFRIVAGLLLFSLVFLEPHTLWGWLGLVSGLVLIGTGIAGRCPIYSLLNIKTCERNSYR